MLEEDLIEREQHGGGANDSGPDRAAEPSHGGVEEQSGGDPQQVLDQDRQLDPRRELEHR